MVTGVSGGRHQAVRRFFLLAAVLLLTGLRLEGFTAPALTGPLTDTAGLFNTEERKQITQTLQNFAKATGGQLFVAVLKSAEGLTIEEIGIKLMDEWKPGYQGKDNGAILIIIPGERKMRLEIGYGWEGAVNDARAGDVIRLLAPYFRKQQYAAGVLAAVDRLTGYITGKSLPPVPEDKAAEEDDGLPAWAVLLMAVIFLVLCLRHPWLLFFFLGGGRGGRGGGGFGGGGFSGGGGGRGGGGGGGGASGGW